MTIDQARAAVVTAAARDLAAVIDDARVVIGLKDRLRAAARRLEAAARDAADAEFNRLAAAAECTTPCDDDCELRPDGCHESHQPTWKRVHQPSACASIRAAIGAAAAAERERIRQLAIHHDVKVDMGTGREPAPFADLLDDPSVPAVPAEGTTP